MGLVREHNPLQRHERHHYIEVATGMLLMLFGSWLSVGLEQHLLPHVLQDVVGYFFHGLGAAPIIGILIGE